ARERRRPVRGLPLDIHGDDARTAPAGLAVANDRAGNAGPLRHGVAERVEPVGTVGKAALRPRGRYDRGGRLPRTPEPAVEASAPFAAADIDPERARLSRPPQLAVRLRVEDLGRLRV